MRWLFAHAHPDDETLATGVLIAELVERGDEVFVLTATRGEQGEVVPGPLSHLAGTLELIERREAELAGALAELGVTDSAWLGAQRGREYRDSGMVWARPGLAGPVDGTDARALSIAPLDDVVADVMAYANTIGPDVIVSYDADGGYGHPDHVRMHEASARAAERLGVPFRLVTYAPGAGVEWFELDEQLPTVIAALRHHATQVSVDGDDVIHSGGQREPITRRLGLKALR